MLALFDNTVSNRMGNIKARCSPDGHVKPGLPDTYPFGLLTPGIV